MQHKYSFDLDFDRDVSREHSLKLDLDISLSDFLAGKDIAVELVTNELSLRQEITALVIEKLIPDMIANSGLDGSLPAGKTNTDTDSKYHSDWEIKTPRFAGSSPSFRSKLQLLFEIKADRDLNAMQALHASNGNVAAAITDNIIFSLKQKYLGISEQENSSTTDIQNGKVLDHTTKSETDFEGN